MTINLRAAVMCLATLLSPVVLAQNAIGHKKIDRFMAVTTDRVRLNILASAGVARVREFQVFSLDGK